MADHIPCIHKKSLTNKLLCRCIFPLHSQMLRFMENGLIKIMRVKMAPCSPVVDAPPRPNYVKKNLWRSGQRKITP